MSDLVKTEKFTLTPTSLTEAMEFSKTLATSDIVPKDFKGNAGNILVAIQWGLELGLQPMQAMQNIAVINGRPSLWGDAVLALVLNSPLCDYVEESMEGDKAICKVKRKGKKEKITEFSYEDAKKAGLLNKQGPWSQYPKRMLQMRARAFALRDVFPDVLKGLPIAEEVQDYQENNGSTKDITPKQTAITREILPPYPEEKLIEMSCKWLDAIEAGKTTTDGIISMISTKHTLTDEQIAAIRNLDKTLVEPQGDAE